MNPTLRTLSTLGLLAAALAASAQATYTLTRGANLGALVLPSPITMPGRYTSGVTGTYNGAPVTSVVLYAFDTTTFAFEADSNTQGFGLSGIPIRLLTESGVYNYSDNTFTSVVNPTPEPATFAALGFGAIALLRRRKKT